MSAQAQAGFIGLGAMGMPMAENLARAGLLSGVWNRTRARAEYFSQRTGVPPADEPAALARSCEIVLICVSRDQDVSAVIEAMLPGLPAGSLVIDCSTIGSDTAQALAVRVRATGADFIDAPVSGGVEGARAASLVVMAGGNPEALSRAMPVLNAIAQRVVHMGPVGSGQATKAVNQIMAAGINQAVTEALAFGSALGLPMDKVLEVVGAGAAGNWFLNRRGASMLAGHYEPGFQVALHHKDLLLCRRMAQSLGAQLPIVEMTLLHYQRLMDAGHGNEDISALFRAKRELLGRK